MVTTPIKQMTPEEFLSFAAQHEDTHFDFMDGEVVAVSPAPLHGWIQALLTRLLGNYLAENPLGYTHTEALHVLGGEKFLPDVSINKTRGRNEAYFTEPPILVIEIRSDSQSRASQRRKAQAYLEHGVSMVWLIMPGEQVEVYTGDEPAIYTKGDTLTCDILPGFAVSVADLIE